MATLGPSDFTAPGPGLWTHNAEHFPRPVSNLFTHLSPWTRSGVRVGYWRYGAFVREPAWEFVHRIQYAQPVPFIALPPGDELAARREVDRALADSPEAIARSANAQRAFDDRLWHQDVLRWDAVEKPAVQAETRRLAAVVPAELDGENLAKHFAECFAHLSSAMARHHHFNPTWVVPLGLLVMHVREWTGLEAGRTLGLLEGASPISRGHSPELSDLADAIRNAPAARRLLLGSGHPEDVLDHLQSAPDRVGVAARHYLHTYGYATASGFDPIDPYALERPGTLVERIRVEVDGTPDTTRAERVNDEISRVRSAVPAEHRQSFDALLDDARLVYRIKDERGVCNNSGSSGLVRRALLEVGRRLVDAGILEQRDHMLEASLHEIQAAAVTPSSVDASSLRDRFEFRMANSDIRPPTTLGSPEPQVPLDWLPAPIQRVQRALAATREAMAPAAGASPSKPSVRGMAAGVGTYEGRARVILAAEDYHTLEAGDVLVTTMTTPALSTWMSLVGAIVTDHGGPLSHAAIVARDAAIPAVVGTRTGTQVIRDGDRVRVDGGAGAVERLA